jgi:hypothetical protein
MNTVLKIAIGLFGVGTGFTLYAIGSAIGTGMARSANTTAARNAEKDPQEVL